MSEPESLATIEGLDEHICRHFYDRLIMLLPTDQSASFIMPFALAVLVFPGC